MNKNKTLIKILASSIGVILVGRSMTSVKSQEIDAKIIAFCKDLNQVNTLFGVKNYYVLIVSLLALVVYILPHFEKINDKSYGKPNNGYKVRQYQKNRNRRYKL